MAEGFAQSILLPIFGLSWKLQGVVGWQRTWGSLAIHLSRVFADSNSRTAAYSSCDGDVE